MPGERQLLFSAFGPRIEGDLRSQLFPFQFGKVSTIVPGSSVKMISNSMDAGHSGFAQQTKITQPSEDSIQILGLNHAQEGLLCAIMTLSGGGHMFYEGVKGSVTNHVGNVIIVACIEDLMHATIPSGLYTEVCGITFFGHFLLNMLEGERTPKILEQCLKAGRIEKSSLALRPSSLATMRITRDVINHPYHGAAERLFLQGKMLELLAELTLADPDDRKTPGKPDEASYGKACHARDILLLDPRNPPDPMELGRMVGASYRTINRAFVRHFGQTAYRFARDAALALAKEELESKGLTVAEAAYKFGYSHPSAFIAAYRRRFGQSPGGKQSGPGAGK